MDCARLRQRRETVAQIMQRSGGGVLILPCGVPRPRNGSVHYPFRPQSNFVYLCGHDRAEPEMVLVLVAAENAARALLFCPPRDATKEMWEGPRLAPQDVVQQMGVDEGHPLEQLPATLAKLFLDQQTVYYDLGQSWDDAVLKAMRQACSQARNGASGPRTISESGLLLDALRLFKDEEEIACMRQAATITRAAHARLMKEVRPGQWEYELAASLEHQFRRQGAEHVAYPTIVAGGGRACVLHYAANNQPLQKDELVLVDAGCEWRGYAADITTTFPVSGKFSAAQRDLYDLVLRAQAAALATIKPNVAWQSAQEAAVDVFCHGLTDLGLLAGSAEQVKSEKTYQRFFMHKIGHWLGLDVHDTGAYYLQGKPATLAAGMVMTVEPGCYVRPAEDVPQHFWNIGVRIEDDVLLTNEGHEVLTAGLPRTADAIEAWMAA